jgi:DnaJ-domain-containing protein 1
MGIIDRLGDLLKSNLRGGGSADGFYQRSGDSDYDAALDELDEMLGQGKYAGEADGGSGAADETANGRRNGRPVPPELAPDFAELGLPPGAPLEDCKAAYKRLLKIHHPDRHAGHPGNMKKATEKSARLNAAFDRIETYYSSL